MINFEKNIISTLNLHWMIEGTRFAAMIAKNDSS